MSTQRMTMGLSVIAVSAFLGVGAEAGNNRSVVSTKGLDTNNCSVPAPCRSFAVALAATNPNGEIIVLDAGGYGPATITQPVTISATGVRASVFTATNINGLTINTTGNVTIKGISFLGGNTGINGIEVDNVGTLDLDNVEVQDFTGDGIVLNGGQNLTVANSLVKDCGGIGLDILTGSAYVRGSSFLHCATAGVSVINVGSRAVVVDSVASFNGLDGATADAGATLQLLRVASVFNGEGGFVSSSTATFAYSLATGNGSFPFKNQNALSGTSPGTSQLDGSGNGALSPAAVLQ